jgi:glycosyltransferase involved in cell wall biosynthesis
MKVLHLCNDYLGSKVHANLYAALYRLEVEQVLYFPLRRSNTMHALPDIVGIETVTGFHLKKYHKIFFRKKIADLYHDLFIKIDFKDIDVIHATTLFSDGALAYKVFKNTGIPYVLAVRTVDVDWFLKLRPDLLVMVKAILLNAASIIFISDALKDNFFKNPFIKTFMPKIISKSKVIYNGIDQYWIEHKTEIQSIRPTKILYVGYFDNNKNVLRLVQAFLLLKKEFPNLELNLVGGNKGAQLGHIKSIANSQNNGVCFLGPIYDKEKLLKIYRANHIFAMVSKRETFGLVYLEALTQGLPLLFTKSQGVDGIFKERIGEAVIPTSVNSIKKGLKKIIVNYGQYNTQIDFFDFDWTGIAQKYYSIYDTII